MQCVALRCVALRCIALHLEAMRCDASSPNATQITVVKKSLTVGSRLCNKGARIGRKLEHITVSDESDARTLHPLAPLLLLPGAPMIHKSSPLTIAVTIAFSAPVALAQDTGSDSRTLDTMIVTGTRVADRTVAESTSPIDIITPEALESTGSTELATALSRALPSLNFPRPAISDGTDAVRPAQLRGLAPDQVLVLVNGKRRHTTALINLNGSQGRGSSPVDLNAIPIASIERVEVLRDGASAQYGSDAIAGVVNIVLKGSDSGGSIAARYGQYSAGDGEQYQLSGDAGFKLGENGKLHLAA